MLEDYDDTDLDEAIANDILDELEDRYDAKHPPKADDKPIGIFTFLFLYFLFFFPAIVIDALIGNSDKPYVTIFYAIACPLIYVIGRITYTVKKVKKALALLKKNSR